MKLESILSGFIAASPAWTQVTLSDFKTSFNRCVGDMVTDRKNIRLNIDHNGLQEQDGLGSHEFTTHTMKLQDHYILDSATGLMEEMENIFAARR